jgi:hypothetical protein
VSNATIQARILADDFANTTVLVEGCGVGKIVGAFGHFSVDSVDVQLTSGERVTVPLRALVEIPRG